MAWNIDVPTAEYYDLEHRAGGWTTGPIEHIINEIAATPEVAIDTETTGLNKHRDIPLYWSLAWGQRRCTLHARTLPLFQSVFKQADRKWLFANAKYDMSILANVGVDLAGDCMDTQVMHALLYEDRSHRLKDMVDHVFGWRWSDFQDTFGRINKEQSPQQLMEKAERENFGLLIEYAADDAWGTLCTGRELRKQLQAAYTDSLFSNRAPFINTLWDLYDKTEVPYTKVLYTCERNGILVNREYLESIAPDAQKEIDDLARSVVSETNGLVTNMNSTAQLLAYFQQIGAPLTKKTKGGKTGVRKLSLDAEVLEHLASTYGVAGKTLRFRELTKLKGTYIDGIQEILDQHGRGHTNFNQDVARTGRLSSSDPNFQNVPKPENDKWKLRGAFVAPPGMDLVVADYAQLEMRLLADGSREPGMIEVIKRGWDIHMGNAAMIYNLPYEEIEAAKKTEKKVKAGELPESAMTERVDYLLRCRAEIKNIGFGLVYGMGDSKLARDLGITKQEATKKSQNFMAKYPAVASFKAEMIRDAETYGSVYTIMGRRRSTPGIHSYRNDDRSQAERIAVNTPIQGSAADVVRMAQVTLHAMRLDYHYGCRMLLQVHDELVFECPKENTKEVKEVIKDVMEHPFSIELSVPLAVDIGSGPSWMHAK